MTCPVGTQKKLIWAYKQPRACATSLLAFAHSRQLVGVAVTAQSYWQARQNVTETTSPSTPTRLIVMSPAGPNFR